MLHRIIDGIQLGDLDNLESSWQKIGIEGVWKGHAMGPFELTRSTFDEIVNNFNNKAIETVVDYEHASVFNNDKAPASGWVSKLDLRELDGKSELWAKISWTKKAEDHIKDREYRYLSPTFQWKTKDRKTGDLIGAQLHSVAVTNRPFLHELDPIRLNSLMDSLNRNINNNLEKKRMDEIILAALGLQEGDDEKALGKIEELKSNLKAILNELDQEDPTAACGEIIKLKNPAVSEEEIVALREENQSLKEEKLDREAKAAVDEALKEGKLTAKGTKQHEWALNYALKDIDGFKAWSEVAPKIVPVEKKNPKDEVKETEETALSDDDKNVMEQLGISKEDFLELKNEGVE